ncbi:MAG: SET domain-containing protein-lysine N-methyltransferase [Thiotrichaceae bacterium]
MQSPVILDNIQAVSGDMSLMGTREAISALEAVMLTHPQVDVPVIHRYSGGIYCREITLAKDTILTGRIYADDHFDVMISGDVTVSGEEGKKRLQGFNVFPGKRGKKRAGYVHEETRWLTFHLCKEAGDNEYIDLLTCKTFEELPGLIGKSEYIEESEIAAAYNDTGIKSDYISFRIGYLTAKGKKAKLTADVEDYRLVLSEHGYTEEAVRAETENESDQIVISGDFGVQLKESIIEGLGLFSTRTFESGEVIMVARVGTKRTIAGRYVNHSVSPNCIVFKNDDNIYLKSINKILEAEELTIDYRVALDLRSKEGICQQ